MRTRFRGAAALTVVGTLCAIAGCGSPDVAAGTFVSVEVLDAYRGQNDLVTLLPAGALTALPSVYETVWGRGFLEEVGYKVPDLDPVAFGALLVDSGETSMWQAHYACRVAADPSDVLSVLDFEEIAKDAVAEAEGALLAVSDSGKPADARALDAIAAIHVLTCLQNVDVRDRIAPIIRLTEDTVDARLALEVQLQEALEASTTDDLVSGAPVPPELALECAGVDAYAAAAAVELGRATFDDVAACLMPYATSLADTQVLYRLTAAGGPDSWRDALIDANLAEVVGRMQPDGTIVGRSNDSGSAGSTLSALRLLRLAGSSEESLPSWVGDGLAIELDRVSGAPDALEGDLVRHACVLAGAPCAELDGHRERVAAVLKTPGPADAHREVYARMAYELGLEVDLNGEIDAATALTNRDLVCVAAAFELADPGSTDADRTEGAWEVMVDHLAAGDVVGASCASWLWRVRTGGQGDDTDRELRRAVEGTFRVGDDGLWRSDLSPAGDLALSYYLYDVLGLA